MGEAVDPVLARTGHYRTMVDGVRQLVKRLSNSYWCDFEEGNLGMVAELRDTEPDTNPSDRGKRCRRNYNLDMRDIRVKKEGNQVFATLIDGQGTQELADQMRANGVIVTVISRAKAEAMAAAAAEQRAYKNVTRTMGEAWHQTGKTDFWGACEYKRVAWRDGYAAMGLERAVA